ncbi:MAG: hypothetical protein M1530_03680 [Candidatus Marsarchaeota archaeon]|nr:hypothetical protein [Candidatus Marsarchaeota archaeon]
MTSDSIEEDIRVIYKKEKSLQKTEAYTTGRGGIGRKKWQRYLTPQADRTSRWSVSKHSDGYAWEYEFETVEVLRKKYDDLKEEDARNRFKENAIKIAKEPEFEDVIYLPFEFFIRLGDITTAMKLLSSSLSYPAIESCLESLNESIDFRPQDFNEQKRMETEQFLKNASWRIELGIIVRKIEGRFNDIKYSNIVRELEETHASEMKKEYAELISELPRTSLTTKEQLKAYIEKAHQTYGAAKDERDYKTSLDLSRSYLHGLYSEACTKIEEKTGKRCKRNGTGKIEDFSTANDFLKTNGTITQKEWDIGRTTYGYLSDEGTHNLNTRREQARIGINFTVEISLILLKKLS